MPLVLLRRFGAPALALATIAAGLSACGGGSSPAAAAPAGSANAGDPHTANVTITAAKGCTADRTAFDAGAVQFKITNQDAVAISEVELLGGERIVGEKENLPPGFSGTFAVNVPAGSYSLYCPGATQEKTAMTVTGQDASAGAGSTADLVAQGTKEYASYVNTQLGYLVSATQALSTALDGTDLTEAQAAYKKARPYYEKIEPVAESFTTGKDNLDADIDARAGDQPADDWTGFHPIEKGLFADKSLKGLSSLGKGLVADAQKLQKLTAGLTYQPYELANGAQELLDEVSSSKITGAEERYSHIDLLDFQANDEGAEQAFADLQPGLATIDSALAASISGNFTALNTLVDSYRSSSDPSGFQLYGQLSPADKKSLAAAVKAVQEPLSQVAAKVAH